MNTAIPDAGAAADHVPALRDRIGVVAIGRNEGERLAACLRSLRTVNGDTLRAVYVDSGSTDGSVELARSMDIGVEELDMSIPFTAARARNVGFARLLNSFAELEYVQFIDGDCEMVAGWIESAVAFLDANPEAAVVCGHRHERHPESSIYNLLCEFDWDGPVGEVKACGGDSVMRVPAFRAVKGFRDDLIAGEEPELCVRLRQLGWLVFRLDQNMCRHDAAMTRFRQWWRRSARAGHAFAEGVWLHGRPPEWHGVRHVASSVAWGFMLPVTVFGLMLAGFKGAVVLLTLYPIQVARIAIRGQRSTRENWINALFLVIAKFAEFSGNARFAINRLRGGPARLIEYK
jgi:GT2 family glycosyltransferase